MEWGPVIIGALTLGGTLATGFFAVVKLLIRHNSEQVKMFINESAANRQVIVENSQAFSSMKTYLETRSTGKMKKKQDS